jgi:ribosomal protein S18 acetylase RimI-like enzyme
MSVRLVSFAGDSDMLKLCAGIYASVWGKHYNDAYVTFRSYTRIPHFYGVVAMLGYKAVGFCIGSQSLPGEWWHESVAFQIGKQHPALQDAWELSELAVLERYRNHHIGLQVLNCILGLQPFPNVVLSTKVNNIGAKRFYERHGWQYLHQGFVFSEGQDPYAILHKRVR